MAESCSKCGAEQGPQCPLVDEGFLFWKRKLCVPCREHFNDRFYFRFYIISAAILAIGILANVKTGARPLESGSLAILFISLLQALMTVPHELGHAYAARALGFSNIRILIGSGAPIWSGSFLGFQWIIHTFPFGGFVLTSNDHSLSIERNVLMVAAGPATSAIPMLLIWFLNGAFLPSIHTFDGAFFWANAVVLMNNIIPYYAQTSLGRVPNDGLIILQLLFPGRFAQQSEELGPKRRIVMRSFKWIAVGLLACCTCLLLLLAVLCFWKMREEAGAVGILVGIFFLGLAALLSPMTIRLAKDPLNPAPEPARTNFWEVGTQALSAESPAVKNRELLQQLSELNASQPGATLQKVKELLATFQSDPWLLFIKVQLHHEAKRYREALEILPQITASSPSAKFLLVLYELDILLRNRDFNAAENLAERIFQSDTDRDHKVEICEQLASLPLYLELTEFYPRLEKWVERALTLSPGNPSVKATHAGLLVELGRDPEAEPQLLRTIERANELHDRAFSMFFLAIIRSRQGRKKEALELLERAIILVENLPIIDRIQKLKASLS